MEKCKASCGVCVPETTPEIAPETTPHTTPQTTSETTQETTPTSTPTQDLELCCPMGVLETHENLDWHGDVCRHWDQSYSCPKGCIVQEPGPYCVQEGTADSPCRINAGEDCTPSICPASHPYLDLDGRDAKFEGNHGDVCRNENGDYMCPEGCVFTNDAPYCAEQGSNQPCRT